VGTPIRVMLAGEYRVALLGLERLINERRPAMEIVATATSCALVCTLAERLLPDVVVIDPEHGCDNVGEIIPTLVADHGVRVLMLVGQRDQSIRESFVLRGASGVVQKDEAPETLLKAIEKVHCGELWLDRSTTGKLFVEIARRKNGASANPEQIRIATLTQREHDVVRKLVTKPGADNKSLATSLHIGEHTLRNHLSRIYDKLGVPNRVELYVFATRNGLTA
jgi:two-component system nitrate/nitrite response regulator NarL